MSRSAPWLVLVAAWLCLAAAAQENEPQAPPGNEGAVLDPMGPNAACYVCHITFLHEELARIHLKAEVTCVNCHGVSAGHANDEDIGATKPDITYAREGIGEACKACHPTHDVPPEHVIARWLERKLAVSPPVCTDCHGTHRLDAPGGGGPGNAGDPAADEGAVTAPAH